MAAARQRSSVRRQHPKRLDLPALGLAAAVLLGAGLTLPIVTLKELAIGRHTYSILSGIWAMLGSGEIFLGLILLAFSVAFPIGKLTTLLVVWMVPMEAQRQRRIVRWLRRLGKWSMLDVLVVVLFVGSVRLGFLADATAGVGTLVFAGAILLSLIETILMSRCLRETTGGPGPLTGHYYLPVIGLLSLGLFLAALTLPLMTVEKWVLWKNTYSILAGTARLCHEGRYFLAAGFALFVIVAPLVEQIGLLALSLLPLGQRANGRVAAFLLTLDEWTMADVFALALFITATKLGNLADVQPRAGLWLYAAATALSAFLSWRMHHLYAEREAAQRDDRPA
jgi:paraquat-inducible protein A